MRFPSPSELNDPRLLERTLQVTAALIAMLLAVLIMLPAAEAPTAAALDSARPGPDRQRHYQAFTLPVTRPATIAPPVIYTPPPSAQPIAVPHPVIPPPPPIASAAHAEPAKVIVSVPEPPPAAIASEPAKMQAVEPEIAAASVPAAVEAAAAPAPVVVAPSRQPYEDFPADPPPAEPTAPIAEVIEVASVETPLESAVRFQRLDRHGEPAVDGDPWSCVRDNRNNLVWEVKNRAGGLRDAVHVYSWFDPRQTDAVGVRDGGRCTGDIDCDTHGYRNAVNGLALCGYDDWRLPARQELQSLVEVGTDRSVAAIDAEFFPATLASWYWSASVNEQRPDYAWYVLFRNGLPLNDLKARPKHVRLVRGERLVVTSRR